MIYGRGAKFPEIHSLGMQLYNQALEMTPGIMTGFDERNAEIKDTADLSFVKINDKKPHLAFFQSF